MAVAALRLDFSSALVTSLDPCFAAAVSRSAGFREGADPPMANTSIFLLHVRDRPLRPQNAGTRDLAPDARGTFGPFTKAESREAARTADRAQYLEP